MRAFILETPDGFCTGRNFTNDPDVKIRLFTTQHAALFTADVLKLKKYVVHPVILRISVKFLGRTWPDKTQEQTAA